MDLSCDDNSLYPYRRAFQASCNCVYFEMREVCLRTLREKRARGRQESFNFCTIAGLRSIEHRDFGERHLWAELYLATGAICSLRAKLVTFKDHLLLSAEYLFLFTALTAILSKCSICCMSSNCILFIIEIFNTCNCKYSRNKRILYSYINYERKVTKK